MVLDLLRDMWLDAKWNSVWAAQGWGGPEVEEHPLNIRMYGNPGVGKTEIGRLIAGMLVRCHVIPLDKVQYHLGE